ncbi:hypothetical protein [Vreelandella alkaliphila]|uniref:Uncharacterized protein n=1 Tax=Vreelandella alkaliphila TaxID=272774 RepID=A0AAJ2RX62_9GAMM|nr:hypothetical protein [Halomonas alkaliphila]MDX5979562.1 hypothetical protein [Halomonas alkaliphila]
MIKIANDGEDIASTNYWGMPHAQRGLLYLSGNAGIWRLLLPAASEGEMLPEMRTGKSVTIEPSIQSAECWDIVFEDGTDSPFAVALDKRQVDRAVEPGECRLTVWGESGKLLDLPCTVR